MRSFLGVPVMTRGVAFGNLYLAEKQPEGSFTDEDEEIVTLLAAQAAVAIENAGSVRRDALARFGRRRPSGSGSPASSTMRPGRR